ncbi:TetR/AcrR family transcriptional regulator [Streptomyces sedi]|uniref:TetR/AcrR family transcriptional regulator n=1 Tax=Streptomyces sedi TaxID=555059 RepID=A0A5C4VEG3_9ACTN|nr:TetR/AcrR family transcriptional regulator [Streptomyces sedi]TNM34188.1 TetR/AcrR family transcriptional regulator [Streptomyces sedi]
MGARDDLLEGAKRCLLDKGYLRTTARDIAAASGANLASIGYHYGSKQALMRQALLQAMGDWAEDMQLALNAELAPDIDPLVRQERSWQRAVELLEEHRGLWRAQFEALVQADDDPELMTVLRAAQPEARRALAALFQGVPEEEVSSEDERVLGSFYMTLVTGLLMQYAVGLEDSAPTGAEFARALRRTTGFIADARAEASAPPEAAPHGDNGASGSSGNGDNGHARSASLTGGR